MARFPNAFERLLTNLINVMFRGLPWIHTCTRKANHTGPCNGWVCDSVRRKVEARSGQR